MIVKQEPKEYYEAFHIFEKCYFCKKPTKFWHTETNTPVCKSCSQKHNDSEIKGLKNENS